MLRHKVRLSLAAVGVALLASLSATPFATAATTSGGNGLRLSPVRTDLTISPGQTQVVTVNVTNVTSNTATLQTIVNDFTANPNESGEPAIILNPDQFASSHSLKRYIGPVSSFTLGPGQETGIPITITIPSNAAGGGYYGAIRFTPVSSGTNPGQNVSLAGSVGSLILVKVPGNIKEQLSIASFDVRLNDHPSSFFTTSKKLTVTVRMQNEGNIQEEPFGKVLLKNHSGKILGSYELNNTTPPGNVLPDSVRKFDVTLTKVGSFGQFKLEGNFGYGSGGQLLSASTTFYVIPISLIIIFIVVVLLVVFLIFGLPRLIKAYNRRILAKARRR
jgi:hypothetical protein